MKLREVLATVAQTRPHAYTDAEMIAMINTIEGRVYTDILQKAEGFEETFEPFSEGQEERELVVPVPFTDLYTYYLASQIDWMNGDSGRYNDSMVLLQNAWDGYAAYYRENYRPKQTNLHGMVCFRHRGW